MRGDTGRRPTQRIGILGGTFDPPHVGHVVAALGVRHALGLDRVLVVPANIPWQKSGLRDVTPAEHRLAMTRAAFAGLEGIEVSTIELARSGDSYSVDTLEELRAQHPGCALRLIVGSDVAARLDTWHRNDDVRRLAELVIYERPGSVGERPPRDWPFTLVALPLLEISSTDLRQRVATGAPIDGLVPPGVSALIRRHRLYTEVAS